MQGAAFGTAGARRAAGGITALVLGAGQLSKSLVLAARPSGGGGLVAASSAVVIAVVAVLLARVRGRAAALLLAAVLGGALGNLADRLFRSPGLGRGAVVDWIHIAGYPATFNLADVAIRAGAAGAAAALLLGDGALLRRWPRPQREAVGSARRG